MYIYVYVYACIYGFKPMCLCEYDAFGDGVHFIFKISFYTSVRFRSLERTCLPNFSTQLHFSLLFSLAHLYVLRVCSFFRSFGSLLLLPFEFISKALSCAGTALK